jgi:hypothetical protein
MRYIDCKILGRRVFIADAAVPHSKFGWICDCGRWTSEAVDSHVVVEVFE